MDKITYLNKVNINENSGIAAINKISDSDMNEIKSVINDNADQSDNNFNISTTEALVGTNELGENVYKITLKYTVSGNSSINISQLNISKVENYESMCHRYGINNNDWEKPYYVSSTDYFRSFIRTSTNTIETRITTLPSAFSIYDIKTTIWYTKSS